GFDPPPPDDEVENDSLYDVYLTNVVALTTPENRSFYYPDREAYTSYIQLGYDLRTPRYPDDPLPFLKVCAAHEYFHAVQFAYRAFSSDLTLWWFEACAGWAEEIVFDEVNDVYYKLDYYLPNLHKSLYQSEGFFTYGTWIYAQFLSDRFGNPIIRKCWERFALFDFAVDAIDLTLDTYGADFNDEYSKHIVWNYFTGVNYQPGFYEEAADFDETVYEARIHSSYPVDWITDPVPQENVSGTYIIFQNTSLVNGTLVIEYLNTTDDKHSVAVAQIRPDEGVTYGIYLVQNYIINIYTVENFTSCEKAVMMPIWLYEGVPSPGITSFSYQAYIDSSSVGIAENEPPVPFEFKIDDVYPNPFNGAANVSFTSATEGYCDFVVYGITGDRIFEKREPVVAGHNLIRWSPSDDIASGVHFFEIIQSDKRLCGKFIYLK
ncbi:MAG: T9SS type A sorting domain-containing protein, partial [Candidatus Zixiibacteriota bacterium]